MVAKAVTPFCIQNIFICVMCSRCTSVDYPFNFLSFNIYVLYNKKTPCIVGANDIRAHDARGFCELEVRETEFLFTWVSQPR